MEPSNSAIEELALKEQLVKEAKGKIAQLCCQLIESPEEHIGKLRELRVLLFHEKYTSIPVIRAFVLISLCNVFKDIIPAYKIRLPSDMEKAQKLKKDIKTLRSFEESLLLNYKKYLDILAFICRGGNMKRHKKMHLKKEDYTKIAWSTNAKDIAVSCAGQLYQTHPTFNFCEDLVEMIVPFLDSKREKTVSLATSAIAQCLKEDRNGDVALRCCRVIHRFAKSRKYNIGPSVIRVFLVLNIKEIAEDEKQRTLKHKEKLEKWSRKQRKTDKLLTKFNRDMEELRGSQTRETRLKLNTLIIKEIFHIYFKVLKERQSSLLLTAVLEGLSKFAHLINMDLVQDIFYVLSEIVENKEASVIDCLHCIHAGLTMLDGKAGTVLTIDPTRFYTHMYALLPKLSCAGTSVSSQQIDRVVECLDLLLIRRRRQVSVNRVLAFVKRLASTALHLSSDASSVLLAALIRYLRHFPRCEVLFDVEAEVGGPYRPEVTDPEVCCPGSAVLWELDLLRHHSCPQVVGLAKEAMRIGAAYSQGNTATVFRLDGSIDLARMTPSEVREVVQTAIRTAFDQDPAIPARSKGARRKRRAPVTLPDWCLEDVKRLRLDVAWDEKVVA